MSLDNLQLFIAVADAGGFSRAAERLDLPVATLSRRIAQLEKELNVPLLKRNTRNVSLTPAGEAFYAQLMPALESVQSAINELSNAATSLHGTIRLTSAADFTQHCLAASLTQFMQRNPEIKLDLNLTHQRLDLVTEQIDVAIRIGALPDSNLFAWHLLDMSAHLFASPDYLAALPPIQQPEDLAACNFIHLRTSGDWRDLHLQSGARRITPPLTSNLVANDMGVVISLCEAGAGVACIAPLLVNKQQCRRTLVQILPDWQTPAVPVHAVTAMRNPPARVRMLIDFLKVSLAQMSVHAPVK
ncbi:MAG: LysR substrate-binding domain-containing protein [Formosimonas sp.]